MEDTRPTSTPPTPSDSAPAAPTPEDTTPTDSATTGTASTDSAPTDDGTTEPPRPGFADRLSAPLRRPRSGRMIAGVCAGMGRAWRVDPILLRLAFVAVTVLFFPLGPIIYALMWILMPQD